MGTNYIAPIWRMPRNANKDKLSNYSVYFSGGTRVHIGLAQTTDFLPGEPTASGNIPNPKFSASIFFNFSSTISGSTRNMLGAGQTGGASYWYLRKNASDNLDFYVRTHQGSPYYTTITGSTVLNADQWYHACVTWDGNNINLYLDGQSDASPVAANNFHFGGGPGTEHPSIGSYWRGASHISTLWTGRLAQASVFNYELSSSQASDLNNGVNPMVFDAPPTFYYPMGDNSNITEQAYGGSDNFFPNISVGADSVFDWAGGVNRYIWLNENQVDSNSARLEPQILSFSFWVKLNSYSNNDYFWSRAGSSNYGIACYLAASKFRFQVGDATTSNVGSQNGNWSYYNSAIPQTDIPIGKWTHVCGIWNGTNTKIFINGVCKKIATPPSALTIDYSSTYVYNGFKIGARNQPTSASYVLDGEMSNFQFWNTALTDGTPAVNNPATGEVAQLYNNGQPLMTGTQPQASNLQVWYKLNQSANWEADTASNWQIPDNRSAYPQSFDFVSAGGDRVLVAPVDAGTGPINSINGAMTVAIWVKTTQGTVYEYAFNRDYIGGSNRDWNLFKDNFYGGGGRMFWSLYNTSGSNLFVRLTGSTDPQGNPLITMNDGKWHHIVGVYDGIDTAELYTDGVLQGSAISSGFGTLRTNARTVIGGYNNSGNPFTGAGSWNGGLSNAQIWDTNLNATQVETLYNNGVPLTTAIATDNLKAWYKLNDNEKFDGTNWSVENQKYPAGFDSALSFPASDDYISIGSTTLGINTAIAISAWVKTSVNTGYGVIIGEDNAGNKRNWTLTRKNDDIVFTIHHDDTGTNFTSIQTSTINVSDNKWHHVVGAWDGTTNTNSMKVYFDGVEVGQDTPSSTGINTEAAEPWIGNSTNNPSGYNNWTGELSNIAVYNTGLDSSAVTALYNNGTPETSISSSPVSWWKLNNLTTGIQDSVGSNNGTNNGATKVNTFVSTEAGISSGMTEQNLVNNNVSALNGESSGMNTTNLVQSNLTRKQPYSSYSFNFDGATNDYFDCTDADIFSFGDGTNDSPFSMSAWIKTSSSASKGIMSKWGTTGTSGYEWIFWTVGAPAKLRVNLNDETNLVYRYRQGNTNIDTGEWVHAVVTYDGRGGNDANDGIKIYVNGQEESSYTNGSAGTYEAMHNTPRIVQIAGYNSVGQFDGQISNAAIFNRVLNEDEILNIYNNGVPQDLQTTSTFSNNIVAWWPMDQRSSYFDGTDWVVRDLENGNDGDGANTNNIEDMFGNAPGSEANGTGNNLTIADLKGNMYNSDKNAYSINMADYADGVDNPANSGRSIDTP